MTPEALGRVLAGEGLVADPVLPIDERADRSPWFVKLLAGAGAWLAAAFLYGATAAAIWPLLGSASTRAAVGLLVCAACAAFMRRRPAPTGVFVAQLLLVASLAGFVLVVASPWTRAGLIETSLLAALLASALLVANPERIHRRMMALALVAALAVAATDLGLLAPLGLAFAAAATLLWSTQARWAAAGAAPVLAPLGSAVTAGLVLVPGLVTEPLLRFGVERGAWSTWLLPSGLAVLLAAAAVMVVRRLRPPGDGVATAGWLSWAAVASTACLAVAAGSTPGVLACLLAWVLAMAAGRGTLATLALVALGWYLLRLYYGLDTSLLGKGVALVATGTVLILLHVFLRWLAGRAGPAVAATGVARG